MKHSELFVVARILAAWGLDGYLKVRAETQSPARLKSLRRVFIGTAEDNVEPKVVDDVIIRPRAVLMRFSGADNRTAAERLVGQLVFTEKETVPAPGRGKYFIHDIVGCNVVSTDGRDLGVVKEVLKYPAQDIWLVRRDDREFMIPVVGEFIKRVDVPKKRITVRLIEGLIDES